MSGSDACVQGWAETNKKPDALPWASLSPEVDSRFEVIP
jgi:hypothetical protein